MRSQSKNRPITLADLDGLATKKDLRDFASFRSEFSTFKDWTQTTLDGVVGDIRDLKQETLARPPHKG